MRSLTITIALSLAACTPGFAVDDPAELMPAKVAMIRPGKLAKVVARPTAAFDMPSAGVTTGSLQLFDTVFGGAGANAYSLTDGVWRGLGSPPGSGGWKYSGSAADACRVILVKPTLVKAVCRGPSISLAPPVLGDLGVVLSVGTAGTQRSYCAVAGGTHVRNGLDQFKRVGADAPAQCPSVPSPPTTSTTSTTLICCDGFGTNCAWSPSASLCVSHGGTPRPAGTVCNSAGGTGVCTAPPASPGPCCSYVSALGTSCAAGSDAAAYCQQVLHQPSGPGVCPADGGQCVQ